MRNSSSLDWLRFMHTPNDYRVSLWDNWGDPMEKWWCLYGETTVSLRRNSRVPPQKLSCPAVETVISNAGNDSSPPGNRKLMHTNFCPPEELAYARFILCCRYFICNLSAAGICNALTIYQLVHYTRLVAGGRCFYIFSGSSSNLVVISFLFQLSSSFLILLKVVDMFAFQ